jgi:hypothetical protein
MARFDEAFKPLHVGYGPAVLVDELESRLFQTARGMWHGPRTALALAALAAVPLFGVEVGFAVASILILFVLYLSYAHSPYWMIYYSETLPVFAALSALGIWRLLAGEAHASRAGARRPAPAAALAVSVLVLLNLPGALKDWHTWHWERLRAQQYQRSFARVVAGIPDERAIVFVRYAPWHNLHVSLITNDPDLESSRAWVVYDRGRDNARLQRIAPHRVPYLFDEERLTLSRYPPDMAAAR